MQLTQSNIKSVSVTRHFKERRGAGAGEKREGEVNARERGIEVGKDREPEGVGCRAWQSSVKPDIQQLRKNHKAENNTQNEFTRYVRRHLITLCVVQISVRSPEIKPGCKFTVISYFIYS